MLAVETLLPKQIKHSGFTLVELIIVIIIIGILATFAMPAYRVTKERALDDEAQANLKLIRAAERIYRMELGEYAACNGIDEINNYLKLSIPVGNPNWNYKVTLSPTNFIGKSQRVRYDTRLWCIDQSTDEPYRTPCTW